jgi:hypothetical protein
MTLALQPRPPHPAFYLPPLSTPTPHQAVCQKCETGYLPKASGRACYCAPGFYTTNSTAVAGSVGFTCVACGPGAFCPGSKITAASSTARFPCGANKLTTTVYATSELGARRSRARSKAGRRGEWGGRRGEAASGEAARQAGVQGDAAAGRAGQSEARAGNGTSGPTLCARLCCLPSSLSYHLGHHTAAPSRRRVHGAPRLWLGRRRRLVDLHGRQLQPRLQRPQVHGAPQRGYPGRCVVRPGPPAWAGPRGRGAGRAPGRGLFPSRCE